MIIIDDRNRPNFKGDIVYFNHHQPYKIEFKDLSQKREIRDCKQTTSLEGKGLEFVLNNWYTHTNLPNYTLCYKGLSTSTKVSRRYQGIGVNQKTLITNGIIENKANWRIATTEEICRVLNIVRDEKFHQSVQIIGNLKEHPHNIVLRSPKQYIFTPSVIDLYTNIRLERIEETIHTYLPFTFEDRELFRDKWVRNRQTKSEVKITSISKECLLLFTQRSFEEAFNDYEFLDGTPFGKLKDQSYE